jgi:hypothetical protein
MYLASFPIGTARSGLLVQFASVRVEAGLCGGHRHTRTEPDQNPEGRLRRAVQNVIGQFRRDCRVGGDGEEDLGGGGREDPEEVSWTDADDGSLPSVHTERAAGDVRVRVEAHPPEALANHHGRGSTGRLLGGVEEAAQQGRYSKGRKILG